MKPSAAQRAGLKRDRPPTPFSSIMEPYLMAHASIEAIVFVDQEGECIDYASRLAPEEAMIMGATWLVPTRDLAACTLRQGAGAALWWMVETATRDYVVRRVTDELMVLLALRAGSGIGPVLECLRPLAEELRAEAGLLPPRWDSLGEPVCVQVRPSPQWGFAPARLDDGAEPAALEVLGRVLELRSFTRPVTLFRVRRGQSELTLAYCARDKRWYRR